MFLVTPSLLDTVTSTERLGSARRGEVEEWVYSKKLLLVVVRKMEPTPEKFSEEELKEILESEGIGGDREFMLEIMGMARDSAKERLAVVDEGIKAGDDEKVWQAAHAMKSTALMAGMKRFAECAAAVEKAYRSQDEKERGKREQGVVDDLRRETSRLLETMKTLS